MRISAPPAPAAHTFVRGPASGSYVGTLAWSTGKTWIRTPLLIGELLGRGSGYDTARGARIAAAALSQGTDRPAVALSLDADDRYRVYSTTTRQPGSDEEMPVRLEGGRPRLPTSGAILTDWIWGAEDGFVELRDGTNRIFPWHA